MNRELAAILYSYIACFLAPTLKKNGTVYKKVTMSIEPLWRNEEHIAYSQNISVSLYGSFQSLKFGPTE